MSVQCHQHIIEYLHIVSARPAYHQLLEESLELPMWSYIHATSASYRQLTGDPWPGDTNSRVYERAGKDGSFKKTITLVKGIQDATEEFFEFRSREPVTLPVDNGTYRFSSSTQAKDARFECAKDARDVLMLPFTARTGSGSSAIGRLPEASLVTGPQMFQVTRAIIENINDVNVAACAGALASSDVVPGDDGAGNGSGKRKECSYHAF